VLCGLRRLVLALRHLGEEGVGAEGVAQPGQDLDVDGDVVVRRHHSRDSRCTVAILAQRREGRSRADDVRARDSIIPLLDRGPVHDDQLLLLATHDGCVRACTYAAYSTATISPASTRRSAFSIFISFLARPSVVISIGHSEAAHARPHKARSQCKGAA